MFTEKEYDKMVDAYEETFLKGPDSESALHDAILDMEENSIWHTPIKTNQLVLTPIEGPLDAEDEKKKYPELDLELIRDTASGSSSHIFVHHVYNGQRVKSWCVRVTGRSTLYEAAKLDGSAFKRMSAQKLAQTLNNGLEVATGTTLLLERYGKASAFHSGADGGYDIMPVPELWNIVKETVGDRFGTMDFREGQLSHKFVSATWLLPEAKDGLLKAYKDVLANTATCSDPQNIMPAVRFDSSDTGDSAARLIPIFMAPTGAQLRLVPGVNIRHERKKDEAPSMERFRKGCQDIYSMFYDAITKVAELSRIKIWNGENCVISLCGRYNIAKKYGDHAREIVASYAGCRPNITAYDVYAALTEVVPVAKAMNAKEKTINDLIEAIDRVLNADWTEHDVGGVVSWGKTN